MAAAPEVSEFELEGRLPRECSIVVNVEAPVIPGQGLASSNVVLHDCPVNRSSMMAMSAPQRNTTGPRGSAVSVAKKGTSPCVLGPVHQNTSHELLSASSTSKHVHNIRCCVSYWWCIKCEGSWPVLSQPVFPQAGLELLVVPAENTL